MKRFTKSVSAITTWPAMADCIEDQLQDASLVLWQRAQREEGIMLKGVKCFSTELSMSNDKTVFELRFEDITIDEGNVLAKELQEEVLAAHKDATVRVTKDDESNQDFGATLVLILGTPTIVIVARAIADYIQRRGVSVTITPEGGVSIKNLKSSDVANVVKNLPKKSS